LPTETKWVFRLDADEVVSNELKTNIQQLLGTMTLDVAGLTVPRRISFLGRPIRYGGVFPVHVLRIFRFGLGRSEDRWMDEHIHVEGSVMRLKGELLDDNLNPLGWWIEKHNGYSSREALQVLLDERQEKRSDLTVGAGLQAGAKRWIKHNVYSRLPGGARAFVYFLYRYVFRGGFLDGFPGLAFHFLQGFWYRFLVDAKLYETRRRLDENGDDLTTASCEILGIEPKK
jgi:hypothetical protein